VKIRRFNENVGKESKEIIMDLFTGISDEFTDYKVEYSSADSFVSVDITRMIGNPVEFKIGVGDISGIDEYLNYLKTFESLMGEVKLSTINVMELNQFVSFSMSITRDDNIQIMFYSSQVNVNWRNCFDIDNINIGVREELFTKYIEKKFGIEVHNMSLDTVWYGNDECDEISIVFIDNITGELMSGMEDALSDIMVIIPSAAGRVDMVEHIDSPGGDVLDLTFNSNLSVRFI
jgi:hypothetical protein